MKYIRTIKCPCNCGQTLEIVIVADETNRAKRVVNSVSIGLQFQGAIAFSCLLVVAYRLIGFLRNNTSKQTK